METPLTLAILPLQEIIILSARIHWRKKDFSPHPSYWKPDCHPLQKPNSARPTLTRRGFSGSLHSAILKIIHLLPGLFLCSSRIVTSTDLWSIPLSFLVLYW